jgi:DedD protein
MADNEGEAPRFDPKHRIIGAIILVALAVIFIPMILDESDAPTDIQGGENAARGAAPGAPETRVVVTPVASLGGAGTPAPAAAEASKPAEPATNSPEPAAGPAAKPETAAPATEPGTAKPAPEHAAATAAGPEKPAKAKKGWIVQVGVYAHVDNARRIETKLREHHYAVLSDTVSLESGKAVRLRVGPYQDKAAADKARVQIQKLIGESVLVRAMP